MKSEAEDLPSWRQRLTDWGYALFQVIDIRLAIVIGITVFLLAVGVDSSGNPASAADYAPSEATDFPLAAEGVSTAKTEYATTYLDYDPQTASRLRHSEVTSAALTTSRLTRAHFFIDVADR